MPVRRIVAHEKVAADRDRVALQRGPIVYAAEWPDNPNGKVRNIVLPDASPLTRRIPRRPAQRRRGDEGPRRRVCRYDEKGAVQKAEQPFMAIPYATWANRGRGQMAVWLARDRRGGAADAVPDGRDDVDADQFAAARRTSRNIIDGEDPRASNDSTSYFDWWPRNGCAAGAPPRRGRPRRHARPCSEGEWIEMAFAKPATVSETQIYWFDDTGRGGVRVPKSWRLLYKDGNDWKPVEAAGEYGVAKDAYNTVRFKPVTTSALRHRARDAAERFGRRAGVEGQVALADGGPVRSTRASMSAGVDVEQQQRLIDRRTVAEILQETGKFAPSRSARMRAPT